MQEKELQKLISNLHRALEKKDKEKEIEARLQLSQYYYDFGEYNKSRLDLKLILKLEPKTVNINYYLALIELQEENYDLAIDYLDKELKLNPKNNFAIDLKDKLKINSNLPLITIFLFFISSFVFILTYPTISFIESIKFGVSDLNIFNAITSIFFHINIWHYLVNMIVLLMFGLILEKQIGSAKFLTIYLVSGMIGNLSQFLFSNNSIVIGASGALFGILGALMMREPLFEIRFLGIFKTPIILVLGSFFLLTTIINYFFYIDFQSADISHFIGLITGIVITTIFFNDSISTFYNWLLISFGFWFIQFSIINVISNNYIYSSNFYIEVFLTIIGSLLILYSYNLLLKKESFEMI